MNTNIICKILKNNIKFLLLNKECCSKLYLFLYFFENIQKLFHTVCRHSKIEMIKILLQDIKVDPSDQHNIAIIWASIKGLLDVAKLLLQDPRVDPSDQHNDAIIFASKYGHIKIVKLLLQDPRVDPSDQNNWSIRWASTNGHTEIFKLLLQDPRVKERW